MMVRGKARRVQRDRRKRLQVSLNNRAERPARTRRIILLAGPGTEIRDLVGPLQVFARAAEKFRARNPTLPPIYSTEVVSTSRQRTILTNCGLPITAHKTFHDVRGP